MEIWKNKQKTQKFTHSPVVRHDEGAEEAVGDGEGHDQRVETVAQLLPAAAAAEGTKKEQHAGD